MNGPDTSGAQTPKRGASRLLFLAAAASLAAFIFPVSNNDLYWHFSAAKWLLAHGAIPAAESLSWSLPGEPWVNFEWLAQLMLYSLYKVGGFCALLPLKLALAATTGFFIARLLALYGFEAWLFAALPLLAAAIWPYFDVSMDNFTAAFFAAWLYFLESGRTRGAPASGGKTLAGAFIFFAFWANLHAGFAFGLLLAGFYAAGAAFEARGSGARGAFAAARPYALLLLAAAAGTLLNPHGPNVYGVLLSHAADLGAISAFITEWKPPSVLNPHQLPYWLLLVSAVLLAARRALVARDVPAAHLLALLYFGWASLSHSRHIPFLALTALPFALRLLSLEAPGAFPARAARPLALALALLCLGHLYLMNRFFSGTFAPGTCAGEVFPAGATAYLKTNSGALSGLRLYNPWGWGGYLGYELTPGYKIFQDGRYLFHRFLPEFAGTPGDAQAWKRVCDRYGFELALLDAPARKLNVPSPDGRGTVAAKARPSLAEALPKKDWALLYWDDQAQIFARRSALPASWLNGREYKLLRPDALGEADKAYRSGVGGARAVLLSELERYLGAPRPSPAYDPAPELRAWYKSLAPASLGPAR